MIDLNLLNYEEKEAIEELRRRMEKVIQPDLLEDRVLFYRFLKARDFNLDRAEKMLRKHINWRKAFQLNQLMKTFKPMEFSQRYTEPSYLGCDKQGDFVHYFPSGKLDGKDVLRCVKINDYMKHWTWFCEKTLNLKKQSGGKDEKVFQTNLIIDLNGLTLSNATSKSSAETCIRAMHILQDNFPEILKAAYVINAPTYYIIIYSIMKPMMSKAMIQKVNIYGHSEWKERLLEMMDADQLPAFLGGKRTDTDGNTLCVKTVRHGDWMPVSLYLSKEDREFRDQSRVIQISVPPSTKKEVYCFVKEDDSVIKWEFLIKDKDIGFGLYYESPQGEIEILPIIRYDTIDGVEVGSYKAKLAGKYIIIFDNTYSWLNTKEIEYCISVVK